MAQYAFGQELPVVATSAAIGAGPPQDIASQYSQLLAAPFRPLPIAVMASPPTIGTLATATAIASPQTLRTINGSGASQVNTSWFAQSVGATPVLLGASFPDYFFVRFPTAKTAAGSSYNRIEFMFDGTVFELMFKGLASYYRVWVDGQLVQLAPITVATDGQQKWQPFTFGSRATRHITIDVSEDFRFGGITIGATDSAWPVGQPRPKALVIGDSFTEGTGATYVDGFPAVLGQYLGWDVWANGQGGSGYVAPGSYTGKFSTRIATYASLPFDAIIVAGGYNDASAGNSPTVGTEAAALFTSIRSTWPTARLIVTSPLINKGVEGWGTYYRTVQQAVKTAALAAGATYVDLMEMPYGGATPVAGTLSSSASASATSISSSINVPPGGVIEIGTGVAAVERRVVTAVSGGGPYTLTVAALSSAHSAAEVLTPVGRSLWTGTGRVGTTTGAGNCDLYVSSDGIHPSQAGHSAIGYAIAELIATSL